MSASATLGIERTKTLSALVALFTIAVLASTPVALNGQVTLAVATACVFVTMTWVQPAGGPLRVFILLLTLFTSTRYMLWRASETIPFSDPVSLFFALALFGAELYGFVILLLSMFLSADVADRRPVPAPVGATKSPTVDILIPTYNEDEQLLEVTVRAAMAVSYPAGRCSVYLLDDGGTVAKRTQMDPRKAAEAEERHQRLQQLCERTGATYLTRERNDHAKAGNINAALTQTSGELILILDADHVPTADILLRTVGYFLADPKLFLVQTPHFFLNPDPVERNLDTFDRMPSENEMFYSVIQKGLDGYNASFFCGSAAVLRRKHIMEIGGIQGETITEDAETALELHARGYHSAYVARPMVAGLSPETFSGFIVQRMRWAQGMAQIFLLKNPLVKTGLTLAQRLGYLNSCFFWFFSLARMAFILTPLVYLIFGIQIYAVGVEYFLAYGVPHVIGALLLTSMLYGGSRWVFASELYEIVQAVHCSGAILRVFRNPRAPTFDVTPKGESLERNFVSPLARPFYILIAVVGLAEVAGLVRMLLEPQIAGYIVVALLWNTFHLFLLIGALGALYERAQRRVFPRIDRAASIELSGASGRLSVRMTDISVTGIGVVADALSAEQLSPGSVVRIDARLLGAASHFPLDLYVQSIVRQGGEAAVGLRFELKTAAQWRTVVALVYSRSQNWRAFQDKRVSSRGVIGQIGFLAHQGVTGALDHLTVIRSKVFRT